MTGVYVDIRVKMRFPKGNSICDHDLENALAIGESIVIEINENEKHIDNAVVIRVGKLNPLIFEIHVNDLIEE